MRLDPDEWAAIYDSRRCTGQAFVFRHGAEVAREACLARATPDEQWVDVGCGTGHLAAELAAAGLGVTGVDSDPKMVRAAELRFVSERDSGRLRFEAADAGRLPFGDGTLDGVVATSLVGCLEESTAFFREVHRVLRPGGYAVITFTNRASVLHAIGGLAAARRRRSPLYLPVRLYSTREAVLELERAALLAVEIRYYNCFLSTDSGMLPPRPFALLLERSLNNPAGKAVARNFLAVATKEHAEK